MLFVRLRQTQRLRQTKTTAGVFYFHDDVARAFHSESHVYLVVVTDGVHGICAQFRKHKQGVFDNGMRDALVLERSVDVVPHELQG